MSRARRRSMASGFERHHVRPRSLGGSNAKHNIVRLTYREHFLAHWLLIRFTSGPAKRKMQHALCHMTANAMGTRIVSGWQYALGRKHQAEATSAMWRGIPKSAAHRKRIGDAHRGKQKKPLSAEHRAAIRAFQKGRKKPPFSAEHCRKIAIARLGRTMPPRSEAYRKKLSDALKGKKRGPLSPERRAQISEAQRGRTKSPEHRAKIGEGRRGHFHTEESKALMSEVKRRRNRERKLAAQSQD